MQGLIGGGQFPGPLRHPLFKIDIELPQALLGILPFGDILQGLDGADDVAVGIVQGGGGEEQPARSPREMGKEAHRLEGPRNGPGKMPPPLVVAQHGCLVAFEDEVSHDGTRLPIESTPVVAGPDDLPGRDAGDLLAGPVPVGDHVIGVDDEGRDGVGI